MVTVRTFFSAGLEGGLTLVAGTLRLCFTGLLGIHYRHFRLILGLLLLVFLGWVADAFWTALVTAADAYSIVAINSPTVVTRVFNPHPDVLLYSLTGSLRSWIGNGDGNLVSFIIEHGCILLECSMYPF